MGYIGAVALASAIKVNNTITELNICIINIYIDDNPLGHTGVTAIAKSLENNKKITKLYLSK